MKARMYDRIYAQISAYAGVLSGVACLVIVAAVGTAAYRYVRNQHQETAILQYLALSAELDVVRSAGVLDLATRTAAAASDHKGSPASILLHALAARAYSMGGDWKAAAGQFELAAQAAGAQDRNTQLLYETSAAVTALQDTDPETVKASLARLESLAQDPMNMHRNMAAFYLGCYAHDLHNAEAARGHWAVLFDQAGQPIDMWGWRARQLREAVV